MRPNGNCYIDLFEKVLFIILRSFSEKSLWSYNRNFCFCRENYNCAVIGLWACICLIFTKDHFGLVLWLHASHEPVVDCLISIIISWHPWFKLCSITWTGFECKIQRMVFCRQRHLASFCVTNPLRYVFVLFVLYDPLLMNESLKRNTPLI